MVYDGLRPVCDRQDAGWDLAILLDISQFEFQPSSSFT